MDPVEKFELLLITACLLCFCFGMLFDRYFEITYEPDDDGEDQ